MIEIYKDIQGYEGLYQVSNLGEVKSLPKGDGNGNRERLLKQEVLQREHTNYRRVTLSKDGVTKRFQVHRLVAKAFIPTSDTTLHINHIDNNGENNTYTNLEWVTHSQNMLHSSKQGRQDLTRSLGGIEAGKLQKIRQDDVHTERVGVICGKLKILSFYVDDSLYKPRTKYICECECGNIVHKIPYNLLSPNRLQMCNECSYKERRHKGKDIVSTV